MQIESEDIDGLKIFLSIGYKLEAFTDSSEDDKHSEYWRFFNRKENSPHLLSFFKRMVMEEIG